MIIVFGTIGFIFGIVFWQFIKSGYLQGWEKLPAPPHRITELISTPSESPFIKTSDGATYTYSDWKNEGWIQESVDPNYFPGPFEITRPCKFSSPEFSFLVKHPQNLADCLQLNISYPDGSGRYTFVLDRNGYLWDWSIVDDNYGTLLGILWYPGSGFFTGLLLGAAIPFLVKKANRR